MVAHPVTDTLPRTAPPRTPSEITPSLKGTQARIGAGVQGGIWAGIVADDEILAAVAVRRQLDERGDALLAHLIGGLGRATGMAKREGEYDLYSLLVDLTATAIRIGELDDAEDTHDVLIKRAALGSRTSLVGANHGIGRLLGQADAGATDQDQGARVLDAVCELLLGDDQEPLTLAWPLDARQP